MTKLVSLHDAIADHVHDGDLIYAAGFTHLIPFAAGHEIIRQGRRGLTLARATPDLIYDQMVAAGCARKVIFSYSGNPGIGSLRLVRAAIEDGSLEWEEYSHFAMITRLTAGAAGLPFLPMNPTGVTDLARANPNTAPSSIRTPAAPSSPSRRSFRTSPSSTCSAPMPKGTATCGASSASRRRRPSPRPA
jgi:glutaconate CoA-transferase subunit A